MTPVQVIGIGLDGADGLTESVRQIVEQATVLVGSDRHLSYFPNHPGDRLPLGNFRDLIETIRQIVDSGTIESSKESGVRSQKSEVRSQEPEARSQESGARSQKPEGFPHPTPHTPHPTPHTPHPTPSIAILTSGDPLFFGLGRLLLAELPHEWLTFHPHLSAVQIAFSRVKTSWQDARLVSAHGRSVEELTLALQQGAEKIAVLTDGTNTPAAIARLLLALDLPAHYTCWVCENLGSSDEQIQSFQANDLLDQTFAPLNVVVLLRSAQSLENALDVSTFPALGVPDHCFLSFSDRPGLITKREVRLLALGELALQPGQTIWDVGAGTGSVSIEVARLFPSSKIYAIEKTAAGITLIQQNSDRFQVQNVHAIYGSAPAALSGLPEPDRIFIGGSGGQLDQILDTCSEKLHLTGVMVLAIATVEHLGMAFAWLDHQRAKGQRWTHRLLQVQLSRSVPVGPLTRLSPLNPVTLVTLEKA